MAIQGHLPPPSVVAEQEEQCYRLHLRGLSQRQIAKITGYTVDVVRTRIKAGAEDRPDVIEQLRQTEADRLDDLRARTYGMLPEAPDIRTKLKVISTLLDISRDFRKLNAVDSPTPLESALIGRAEVESQLIATAVQAAIEGVVTAADVDAAFAQKLREYAFELAARELERADGGEPTGPMPEVPKPQLALTAGSPVAVPDGPDEGGPTSGAHPRRRDPVDGILARARALLEETDDEEDDQGRASA